MRAPGITVYSHLRDRSLLVASGRRVELPLSAQRVAQLLSDGSLDATEDVSVDARNAEEMVRRLRRALAAPTRRSRDTVNLSACVVVDDEIVNAVGADLLRKLCSLITTDYIELAPAVNSNEPAGSCDLLVTIANRFDYARMTAWEDWAAVQRCRWAPFYVTDAGGAYGPFVESGRTPGIRDLASRWITAAKHHSHARAILSRPAVALPSYLSRNDLAWLLATFLTDVSAWARGGKARGSWHNVTLDPERLAMRCDPVLPIPGGSHTTVGIPFPEDCVLSPTDVLNSATGVVVATRPIKLSSTIPIGVKYFESQTADMSRLLPWASNIYNAGSSWDSVEQGELGAIGEAVERYCGNIIDDSKLVRASYLEMRRRGQRAVDPREFVLFSGVQYATSGFPFIELDHDLRISWTLGTSLVTNEPVWVPASLVYVNWNSGLSIYEPPTNPAYYPGIAAGTSRDYAICNAIEEVVERDAAMVWWLSGARLPVTYGPPNDFVKARSCTDSSLSVELIPIPSQTGFPTMGAAATDNISGLCALGLAARITPEEAAKKALLEAFGLIESGLDMQNAQGGFWQAYASVETKQAIKPIRNDRMYLNAYREDFRDVTDLFCQLQIQLDPRARPIVSSRWETESAQVPWESLVPLSTRSPNSYAERLSRCGYEPVCVDLTTSDVETAGWHVVRVIIPGMTPNFPTAFPPLGRQRVFTEPVRLGWVERPLDYTSVWQFPMPYA